MNEELTQEEKQAIWAAGWLVSQGNPIRKIHGKWMLVEEAASTFPNDDNDLVKFATDQGMDLPPELVGPKDGGLER
jgi:hypothetical protein